MKENLGINTLQTEELEMGCTGYNLEKDKTLLL
jgi:hypothetical protein